MSVKLKPIDQQTIVITGASSGIGLCTARMAAKKGAAVVLASRNQTALRELESELRRDGGRAVFVEADVGVEQDHQRIADAAIQHFGGFDTWVNNAGVSIYGTIEQVSIDDMRRVFDTNFWGVVYGSRLAAQHLRARAGAEYGGAIINIGSTLSDRAVPLQGIYCATKHAVKAFDDALRMELEHDSANVSVTTIKPAAIDTMYVEHAKNYLPEPPSNPPPVYAPETVARAILHAAVKPQRDIYVGAAAKMFSLMEKYAPRTTDRIMEKAMWKAQQSGGPQMEGIDDGLYSPGEGLRERGRYKGHVAQTSLYTQASLHPVATTALVAAGLAVAGWFAAGSSSGSSGCRRDRR